MSELGADAFDFWIGEWDGDFEGGHAVNTIGHDLDGRVMSERFVVDTPREWHGMSVSVYTDDLDLWQQTWVDQSGNYWHFVGARVDGDPSFGTPVRVDADQLFKRMVFSDIAGDSFEWRWESSPDGDVWSQNWAISYRRRS